MKEVVFLVTSSVMVKGEENQDKSLYQIAVDYAQYLNSYEKINHSTVCDFAQDNPVFVRFCTSSELSIIDEKNSMKYKIHKLDSDPSFDSWVVTAYPLYSNS